MHRRIDLIAPELRKRGLGASMQGEGDQDLTVIDTDLSVRKVEWQSGPEPTAIMFIGDDDDVFAQVRTSLTNSRCDITRATSGSDAVHRAFEKTFHAALLRFNGDESSAQIEQLRLVLPTLPLVLLCTDAEHGSIEAARHGIETHFLNEQSPQPSLLMSVHCAIERQQRDRQLIQMAHEDALTGLANKTLFDDRLRQAVMRAQRTAESVAVVLLDLERSASVGDANACVIGNRLLRAAGTRIVKLVRECDTVARLDSDRFGVILEGVRGQRNALAVAEKMVRRIGKAVTIDGLSLKATANAGIAIFPEQANDFSELMALADVALRQAKRIGGGRCCVDSAMCRASSTDAMDELNTALAEHQFRVFYQPYVELNSGKLAGVEALLRWKHPRRGVLSPREFLPQLEQSGLINQIGRWIMLTACRQMREWIHDGTADAPISVNVSTRQLLTPGFQGMVESVLRETGLEPSMLVLEIPENLQHRQAVACVTPLRALRGLGVCIALDSFGGEGRALASVHDIPANIWKIDQSFVQKAADDEVSAAILSTLIDLGRRLDVKIVAKGVESPAQIESLRAYGADAAQGLLLCSPMPAMSICKWVQMQQAA